MSQVLNIAIELGKELRDCDESKKYTKAYDAVLQEGMEKSALEYENAILLIGRYNDEDSQIYKDAMEIINQGKTSVIIQDYIASKKAFYGLLNSVNEVIGHYSGLSTNSGSPCESCNKKGNCGGCGGGK